MSKNQFQIHFGKKFWIKLLYVLVLFVIERGKRKYMMVFFLLCQINQHKIML